jgi:hypothetical protein
MMFLETSALKGHNIEEAFSLMIAGTACPRLEIVRRQKLSGGERREKAGRQEVLQVTKLGAEEGKAKRCCN